MPFKDPETAKRAKAAWYQANRERQLARQLRYNKTKQGLAAGRSYSRRRRARTKLKTRARIVADRLLAIATERAQSIRAHGYTGALCPRGI
jgi:hypothetical protein